MSSLILFVDILSSGGIITPGGGTNVLTVYIAVIHYIIFYHLFVQLLNLVMIF